jgi:hypothetical protein
MRGGVDLVGEGIRPGENDPRSRLLEHVGDLLLRAREVDADRNCTDSHGGNVEYHPFRRVVGEDRDAVPDLDPGGDHGVSGADHSCGVFAPRRRDPRAVNAPPQRWLVW